MSPYDVLEVDTKATPDQIKKAYRKKVRKSHPDVKGGNEEKFKKEASAYAILVNPLLRDRYDQTGEWETNEGAKDPSEQLIITIWQQALASALGHDGFDFQKHIHARLHEQKKEASIRIESGLKTIEKLRKHRDKIKVKKGQNNFLVEQVDLTILQGESEIEAVKKHLAVTDKALDIFQNFTIEKELEPEIRGFNSPRSFICHSIWGNT